MSPQALIDLADRLMIAGAILIEDLHPSLVAAEGDTSVIEAKADALSTASDRLSMLARCASILLDIAADQDDAA